MTQITETRPAQALPSRFREAEARGARIGRLLRVVGRVPAGVDEALMERIGQALLETDEAGAALADAMRTRADDRVTHAQLRTALHDGIDAVPDAPEALRTFMDVVSDTPSWVDWDRIERGGQVFTRFGKTAADVLMQLSLIGGYRFGGPTDLLVATGGLTGGQTLRRLAETQHWTISLGSADSLRPGGEGWRLTVHVRAMHALVNASFEPEWDTARWGLPINMADQVGTLGLFDGTLLIGARALGIPISRREAADLMHLWRYVGWLLGVHPDFLTDEERERHRINLHVLLAAGGQTPAGVELARSTVAAQRERVYAGWPSALQGWRARYEQERMLSMMTVFLSRQGMRDLGLSWRLPWAFGTTFALNTWRHRVVGRLPGGKAWLYRSGVRSRERIQASYFGEAKADVAHLPS